MRIFESMPHFLTVSNILLYKNIAILINQKRSLSLFDLLLYEILISRGQMIDLIFLCMGFSQLVGKNQNPI